MRDEMRRTSGRADAIPVRGAPGRQPAAAPTLVSVSPVAAVCVCRGFTGK